jgi:predicted amidophosphoribosyltransferase
MINDLIADYGYKLSKALVRASIPEWAGSCVVCHQYDFSGRYFCKDCHAVLRKYEPEFHGSVYGYPFPVYSVWKWHNLPHRPFYRIIRGLKQQQEPRSFRLLAELAVNNALSRGKPGTSKKPNLLVPAPSSGPNSFNHAIGFASAIANQSGWEIDKNLVFRDKRTVSFEIQQKTLGRQARMNRKIQCVKKFDSKAFHRIIFVDDVITSGATATSAWQALGKPVNFEVWTVLARANLPKTGAPVIPMA